MNSLEISELMATALLVGLKNRRAKRHERWEHGGNDRPWLQADCTSKDLVTHHYGGHRTVNTHASICRSFTRICRRGLAVRRRRGIWLTSAGLALADQIELMGKHCGRFSDMSGNVEHLSGVYSLAKRHRMRGEEDIRCLRDGIAHLCMLEQTARKTREEMEELLEGALNSNTEGDEYSNEDN